MISEVFSSLHGSVISHSCVWVGETFALLASGFSVYFLPFHVGLSSIMPQEAALLGCCVKFSDKCWGPLNKNMPLIYDVSNYCSESRPFRLHSAFNLTEFKQHKMPFSWNLACILRLSFQWETFRCKYGLFGLSTNATIMTDEGFWSHIYKLKP